MLACMAMSEHIITIIKDYFKESDEVLALYLFGSLAKGKIDPEDVDIAILYDSESIPDLKKRLKIIDDLSRLVSKEVDLVILNNADTIIKHQIYKNCKIIIGNDSIKAKRFLARSIIEYLDFSYNRIIAEIGLKKSLKMRKRHG